jgi:hypothetical protein
MWLWEAISFAFALVLFGIYIWLILRYNRQPVSSWEQNNVASSLFRTLPSALSFITTLLKGAVLYPVASAMGQLKWHHFRYRKRVRDMELIDSATRGYLGSMLLLSSKTAL